VPEQDQRQARMIGPYPGREQPDVLDQRGPAALAEVTERTGIRAGPVTAVILRVDSKRQ
jgi:hypothetical protein